MHNTLTSFLDSLIIYDYFLFGAVFILFILFVILGLVYREKLYLAIFLITLAFFTLIFAPIFGYIHIHNYFYYNETTILSQKKLQFTKAVVVKGKLENLSKLDFERCLITASAYKVSGNAIKDFVYKLSPFQKTSVVEYNIPKDHKIGFKIIISPFVYEGDFNVSVGASCQ
ncbi:MAG: DUF2393 family protein [Sulfurimonas sp.]|jgi:hypothetical protein|nr:DUF2393 family protein [Sulfurimonas sp.]